MSKKINFNDIVDKVVLSVIFETKKQVIPKNKLMCSGLSFDYDERNSLMEGYFSTFPIEKTIDYISNRFSLTTDHTKLSNNKYNGLIRIEYGDNDEEMIALFLPTGNYDIKLIDSDMSLCGYFLSTKQPYYNYDVLYYEKRHQSNINDKLLKYEYLYHVSPLKYKEKILKNGLVPKTLSKLGYHPDRVYFTVDKQYCEPIVFNFKQVVIDKYNRETDVKKKKQLQSDINDKYVVYRIKVDDVIDKVVFFYDPNMMGAVYTTDNINPNVIEIENII